MFIEYWHPQSPNKDMNMIRHGIDLNDGLIFAVDDAGDIFVEFIFVWFWDRGLSSFDSENDVNVELGVCVCHLYFSN